MGDYCENCRRGPEDGVWMTELLCNECFELGDLRPRVDELEATIARLQAERDAALEALATLNEAASLVASDFCKDEDWLTLWAAQSVARAALERLEQEENEG